MKQIGDIIVLCGLVIWFTETCYFGWGISPLSEAEAVLITIAKLMVIGGGIIYWSAIVTLQDMIIKDFMGLIKDLLNFITNGVVVIKYGSGTDNTNLKNKERGDN
jgi:hypothetical protein